MSQLGEQNLFITRLHSSQQPLEASKGSLHAEATPNTHLMKAWERNFGEHWMTVYNSTGWDVACLLIGNSDPVQEKTDILLLLKCAELLKPLRVNKVVQSRKRLHAIPA